MGLIYCKDKGFDCGMCRLKKRCKEMCPPIEWVVAEVEVEPMKEAPLNPDKQVVIHNFPETPGTGEMVIKMYFIERMSAQEIANNLGISKRYANKIIAESKKKIAEYLTKQAKNRSRST